LLVPRSRCILYCDFNINNAFKCNLFPSSVLVYYSTEKWGFHFLKLQENYNILGLKYYHLKLHFCKHNGNTSVLSGFTCFVSVFWHAAWQRHKFACLLFDHGMFRKVFFNEVININWILFFFHTLYLSPSRELVTLKTSVFVHWHQLELTLPAPLIYYYWYYYYYYHHYFDFTHVFMETQNVPQRLWMLLVFEFFLVISESPPRFRHSYQLSFC